MSTQLTPHFTLEEFLVTSTGLDDTPSPIMRARINILAIYAEKVRAIIGLPMHIDSGYRSPAVNAAVGGVPNSAHAQAYAFDFVVDGMTSYAVCQKLAQAALGNLPRIMFDQLIQEGTWTHISRDPLLRGQLLTLVGPGQYVGGIVHNAGS